MGSKLRVESVRKVRDDGSHNAFTDLCRFRDRYYLAFRSCPEGHMVFPTSRIVVLESADCRSWREVHRFGVPDRDVRDPHFLVLADTLFVVTGCWLATPGEAERHEMNDHRGYACRSRDGTAWEGPDALAGTDGFYVWRAASFAGTGYLNGRCKRDFAVLEPREREWEIEQSWLLRSADGLSWERVGMFQETYGDETAFVFEEDGAVVAVVRHRDGRRTATVCRARPAYAAWRRRSLDRQIGGPLLARWEGRLLVAGRDSTRGSPVTALFWLVDDALEEAAVLPSGGDTSYPGFVATGPGRAVLSYYSSHEGSGTSLAPSAIYLAELALEG